MLSQKELIYSTYWDILIILDASRPDIFEEVCLPIMLKNIDGEVFYTCVKSEGSCTVIWFSRTFRKPLKDVVYISNNPLIKKTSPIVVIDSRPCRPIDIFANVVEVFTYSWRKICYTHHFDPVLLINTAKLWTKISNYRLILHFVQPHAPYPFSSKLAKYFSPDYVRGDHTFWTAVKKGEVKPSDIREAYIQNMKWICTLVTNFIRELDKKIIIVTSDHSEDFGELGIINHPCWEGIELQYGKKLEILKIVPFTLIKKRS